MHTSRLVHYIRGLFFLLLMGACKNIFSRAALSPATDADVSSFANQQGQQLPHSAEPQEDHGSNELGLVFGTVYADDSATVLQAVDENLKMLAPEQQELLYQHLANLPALPSWLSSSELSLAGGGRASGLRKTPAIDPTVRPPKPVDVMEAIQEKSAAAVKIVDQIAEVNAVTEVLAGEQGIRSQLQAMGITVLSASEEEAGRLGYLWYGTLGNEQVRSLVRPLGDLANAVKTVSNVVELGAEMKTALQAHKNGDKAAVVCSLTRACCGVAWLLMEGGVTPAVGVAKMAADKMGGTAVVNAFMEGLGHDRRVVVYRPGEGPPKDSGKKAQTVWMMIENTAESAGRSLRVLINGKDSRVVTLAGQK